MGVGWVSGRLHVIKYGTGAILAPVMRLLFGLLGLLFVLIFFYRNYVLNRGMQRIIHGGQQQILHVKWYPPDIDWVSIHTDGAFKRNASIAGSGGVLRNAATAWLGGFSRRVGRVSAFEAKL